MSHGDAAETLPTGFSVVGKSENSPYAAIASGNLYAVQFHPEVTQTENGMQILVEFCFRNLRNAEKLECENYGGRCPLSAEAEIGPEDRVLCALSGGVDSATTAELLRRVIGNRVFSVFVDHGLLRKGERERIEAVFKKNMGKNFIVLDESRIFLNKLRGVRDPERKRRIVGREFISAFVRVSQKIGGIKWLAQGTLYTDVIESAAGLSKHESKIKSHHNVAGLPKKLGFKLIEPLSDLYKDEVRKVATELGLPTRSRKDASLSGSRAFC